MDNLVEVWEVELQHRGDLYPIRCHYLHEGDIPSMKSMQQPIPTGSVAKVTISKTLLDKKSIKYRYATMNSRNNDEEHPKKKQKL